MRCYRRSITLIETRQSTRFIFYKNELYKNVEAENCRKFKNVLRMFPGSNLNRHRNLFMYLHEIW